MPGLIQNKEYRREFLFLSFLYLIAIGAILPFTLWYVNNPDAFQYISIAEKLKAGHFAYALNGYWGPLLSWLMLIPLFVGINSIIAFKILQVCIGLLTIYVWYKLSIISGIRKNYRIVFCISVIPFIVSYALLNLTADLLFLCLVLYFIITLFNRDWLNNSKSAILLGVLGAAMYYAKAFGVPLFLTLFGISVFASKQFFQSKTNWRNAGIVLLTFLGICSVWIFALSIKYGEFTVSRAAKFNMTKEVAPLPGSIMHLPVLNGPLLAPSDEYAISAWESPGEVVRLHSLKPLSSEADKAHYLQLIKRNLLSIWYYDFRNQTGILFAAILLIFLFSGNRESFRAKPIMFFLLLVIFIFYAGYSLILIHTRYVWICTGLMLLLAAWMLDTIRSYGGWKKKAAGMVYVLLILVAVKRPSKEILFTKDADIPLLWIRNAFLHPFETLEIMYRPDRKLYMASVEIKNLPELQGNLASLLSDDPQRHRYSSSLFIASQIGSTYFGPLKNNLPTDSMKAELALHKITAFLVWNNDEWSAKNEDWVQLLYENKESRMSVYKILLPVKSL